MFPISNSKKERHFFPKTYIIFKLLDSIKYINKYVKYILLYILGTQFYIRIGLDLEQGTFLGVRNRTYKRIHMKYRSLTMV